MTRKKVIDFAKIGEKLSLTGSNCHLCKSTMTVQASNACRSKILDEIDNNRTNSKKKTCNKKFCYDCLQKSFPTFWENRNAKDWKCPCCLGECVCIQCKKFWIKQKSANLKQNMNRDDLEEGEPRLTEKATTSSKESLKQNILRLADKFPTLQRPKLDIVQESSFLSLKHAREEYDDALDKYKDYLNSVNLNIIKNP